jgi:hypothetical protein
MYQEFCILFQDSHVIEHVDQYSIAVSSMHTFMYRISPFLILLLIFGTVSAQFNFFENMFGHGQQQQQQQQQQRSGASQWAAYSDSGASFSALCIKL